jgi:hypothetical protein
MRVRIGSTAFCLLWLAGVLAAETSFATRAYVVSVDTKARSMVLKHSIEDGKQWKESVVFWDEATTWARSDTHIWEQTAASADLAKSLKKDDKVYVAMTDRGGKQLWLKSLRTIPPTEKVEWSKSPYTLRGAARSQLQS